MAAVSVATGTAALGFVLVGRIFVCTFNPIRILTNACGSRFQQCLNFTYFIQNLSYGCRIGHHWYSSFGFRVGRSHICLYVQPHS
ncbi:hypothetical protein PF005_g33705 [Phytophthora fragariae]|uniref:Uncharacterized protein n=1 Tax=Phytophthora fragariae TaxID=53985 RepID=A0A6A3TZF2_9STRA|nr:hypothetical protein PF005_g33705 [Phytophthora fragariae]